MNRIRAADAGLPASAGEAAAASLRAVHRAVGELRRGTPVRLGTQAGGLVCAAVETLGARGLAELLAVTSAPPVLLLAPPRAATLGLLPAEAPLDEPVALRLPDPIGDADGLRGLADPTAPELLRQPPETARLPIGSAAALVLTKLARLLPAALVAPARASGADLLEVGAEQVAGYGGTIVATLRPVARTLVPLEDATDARMVAFRPADGGIEHLAILVGEPERLAKAGDAPLARLHSECFTGDLLGSLRCDCGPQLRGAIRRMAQEGSGVLLYLGQEGRGIGLPNKLRAYALQCQGLDTLDANRALGWDADERDFAVAAAMLEQLGIGRVRLLTNNPAKVAALASRGIEVQARESHAFAPNGVNDDYLATKARRFGHLLA